MHNLLMRECVFTGCEWVRSTPVTFSTAVAAFPTTAPSVAMAIPPYSAACCMYVLSFPVVASPIFALAAVLPITSGVGSTDVRATVGDCAVYVSVDAGTAAGIVVTVSVPRVDVAVGAVA